MQSKKNFNIHSNLDYKKLEFSLSTDFNDIYIDSHKKVDHDKQIILSKLGITQIDNENSIMSNVIDSFIDGYRNDKNKLDNFINNKQNKLNKLNKLNQQNDNKYNTHFNNRSSGNDYFDCFENDINNIIPYIQNPYDDDIDMTDIGLSGQPNLVVGFNDNFDFNLKKNKKNLNSHISMFALSSVFMFGCAMFNRIL